MGQIQQMQLNQSNKNWFKQMTDKQKYLFVLIGEENYLSFFFHLFLGFFLP